MAICSNKLSSNYGDTFQNVHYLHTRADVSDADNDYGGPLSQLSCVHRIWTRSYVAT